MKGRDIWPVITTVTLLLLMALISGTFSASDIARVQQIEWTTITNIYERVARHSDGWYTVPKSAFNIKCDVKKEGYHLCFCNSSDYKSCQRCPVLATLCEYDYPYWKMIESIYTSGRDYSPLWPEIPIVGSEQKLETQIGFAVIFEINNYIKIYNPINVEELSTFSVNDIWKIETVSFDKIKPVSLIKKGKLDE